MAAGVHLHLVSRDGHHPFDEGLAGRLLHTRNAANDWQGGHETAQRAGGVVLLQGWIKGLGCTKHHDFAAFGLTGAVGEFLHQQPVLQLQARQHRAGRDVARLNDEMTNSKGHRQGDHQAAPEPPTIGRFRAFFGPVQSCWLKQAHPRGKSQPGIKERIRLASSPAWA